MAVVGAFGSLVFQASERTIQTIDNAEWSGSARYAVHQRHNQNALTEFTGLDPDKFKFTMQQRPLYVYKYHKLRQCQAGAFYFEGEGKMPTAGPGPREATSTLQNKHQDWRRDCQFSTP